MVVPNAGVTEQVPRREITPEHYDRVFALNAEAPLSCSVAAQPGRRNRRSKLLSKAGAPKMIAPLMMS